MLDRFLTLNLPPKQSIFLWGSRQTGKTSYLKHHFPKASYYDLLDTALYSQLIKFPHMLREEVLGLSEEERIHPVIIDEVQKVPELLNEVHWLIENTSAWFILCGSSARKLKTQSTNLLGGRAWRQTFYPLVFVEIPDFDLLRALTHGLLPKMYLSEPAYIESHLQAYVDIYLTDEIRNEGLVRNLPGFARFLDVAGMSSGEMINASNIAQDCGIDRLTVQNYFQILVDTMLGYYVYPYRHRVKRDIITKTPKFYLFDVGVANHLAKRKLTALVGEAAGHSFEHYLYMEIVAYLGFIQSQENITYWRTKGGYEVDFIVGDARLAIEVKISETPHLRDLKGLSAFVEEHPATQAMVVCMAPRKRVIQTKSGQHITVYPWEIFLENLYAGAFEV